MTPREHLEGLILDLVQEGIDGGEIWYSFARNGIIMGEVFKLRITATVKGFLDSLSDYNEKQAEHWKEASRDR